MGKTIHIQLYAGLSSFTPQDVNGYPIAEGMTIREVMENLGVPMALAKLIFVNGKKSALDQRLSGGERIGIFPPVAGG
ncbi:MAG: MoaD/ThiS family protein [Desulfobacterales bacterium]|jgi:molybdopterin converting factor small subunit|nr:MoaD/ThiS family protein [Desulfobacterales bacterium]